MQSVDTSKSSLSVKVQTHYGRQYSRGSVVFVAQQRVVVAPQSQSRSQTSVSLHYAPIYQCPSALPLSLAYLRSRMRTDFFSRNGPLNLQISISLDNTIALRGETKKGCGLWVVDRIGIRSVTYRRRVAYFYKI